MYTYTKPCRCLLVPIFAGLLVFAYAGIGSGEDEGGEGAGKGSPVKEEQWEKDLDRKIDTTIEVLKVIKTELKDVKSGDEAQQKSSEDEAALAEKLGKTVSKTASIWSKVRKIIRSRSEEKDEHGPADEKKVEWAKDLNKKLDKTIRAMQVMKEELDKIQEDQ